VLDEDQAGRDAGAGDPLEQPRLKFGRLHRLVGQNMNILVAAIVRQCPDELQIGDVFAKRIRCDPDIPGRKIDREASWPGVLVHVRSFDASASTRVYSVLAGSWGI